MRMDAWELTEYELAREAQEVSVDNELTINPQSLYREIICPICLEVLNQTRAAPDCLHRFCRRCVDQVVKKECPVCHKKLPSQARSFREDKKFDQLVARIHASYQATRPSDGANRLAQSLECEIVLKNLDGSQTRYLKCPHTTTVDHLERYLAIRPGNAKLPILDNEDEFKLSIVANKSQGYYEMLPGHLQLNEVKIKYMNSNSSDPLELYYHSPSKV